MGYIDLRANCDSNMAQWLVIGISGVSCGGKSTLASGLNEFFSNNKNKEIKTNLVVGETHVINQDTYFLSMDDPRHIWVEQLGHYNWDVMTALDMDKMIQDIRFTLKDNFTLYDKTNTFQKPQRINILIIEGFLIFNHPQLLQLTQVKFHIHLPYEKSFARRQARVYDPPDVPGYFEMIVWPMYERHFREFRDCEDIIMLNGEIPAERLLKYSLNCIGRVL